MRMPLHKTRIVATIGPASDPPEILERMIRAGMSVARLNFSHGTFEEHARRIERLRAASRSVGRELALMADLPGPKLRIGRLAREPVELTAGEPFTLTTEDGIGDSTHAAVSFERLPRVVKPGDQLYLNDGWIQLEVVEVAGPQVRCRVLAGGELRSHKGLNLPGIDLGIGAFTARDRECLRFALEQGVDAVSQSFVESAADVEAVRQAASELGHEPFIIAKIERSRALDRVDEILAAADGLMVARGDLGVEVPVEQIAVLQKRIVRRASRVAKPVITATQMLESMTHSPRPTRAESTDVANAILDGTDCVMLSGESATGDYPVEAVATLARIAAATEPYRPRYDIWERLRTRPSDLQPSIPDLLSVSVEAMLEFAELAAIVVPTHVGSTARSMARFRLPIWVVAPSSQRQVCRNLLFSYGIVPLHLEEAVSDWTAFARELVRDAKLAGKLAVLVQGPSPHRPGANHRMEMIELEG